MLGTLQAQTYVRRAAATLEFVCFCLFVVVVVVVVVLEGAKFNYIKLLT